mgnify:CR=1 FL=1
MSRYTLQVGHEAMLETVDAALRAVYKLEKYTLSYGLEYPQLPPPIQEILRTLSTVGEQLRKVSCLVHNIPQDNEL